MEKEEPSKKELKQKKKKIIETKTVKKPLKPKSGASILPSNSTTNIKKNLTQESMDQMQVENIPDSTEASLQLLNNSMGDIILALKQQ